jgi:hypothetical protein
METTVEEIHQAVYEESQVLLNEDSYSDRLATARALRDMGFKNSENVRDIIDHEEHHKDALRYRTLYPQYKFITAYGLSKVMERFGLEQGFIEKFKGAIPEKNALELIKARINADDLDVNAEGGSEREAEVIIANAPAGLKHSPLFRVIEEKLKDAARHGRMSGRSPRVFAPGQIVTLAEMNAKTSAAVTIVADPKLFETAAVNVCPMPVVAVKGGYLVITAWGAEASAQEVVNEKMN